MAQVEHLFRTCLGNEFYTRLLADMSDYSDVTEYTAMTAFNVADLTVYNGIVYQCIQAISDSQTITPPNIDYWVLAPKFESDCVESFWCSHMGPYIAHYVAYKNLTPSHYKLTNDGVVNRTGDNFESATDKGFLAYANYLRGLVDILERNFDAKIREMYKTCTILSYYKPLGVNSCSSCGCAVGNCSIDCNQCDESTGELDYIVG